MLHQLSPLQSKQRLHRAPRLQFALSLSLTFLLVLNQAMDSNAQSKEGPLSDDERASVMFDFNLKEIREHSLMKDFDPNEMMAQQGLPPNEDFDIAKVNRIFGGMQIPTDPADMQPQPGQDLPTNFFVRIEFTDSSAADEMIDNIKEKGARPEEVSGKTYYVPKDDQSPANLRLHKVNKSTVEMGTERYVLLKDRNVVSTGLKNYWKQVSKENAFRLSIDLESNREFIDTMMAQAKMGAPSNAAPYLELVDDLAGLSLGFDFDSDSLLTLRASGKDSEGTEKLRTAIDGILGMGKFMGQSQLSNLPMEDDVKKVFGEIIKSLKATSSENTVSVDIAKPDGFDDAIKGMMNR